MLSRGERDTSRGLLDAGPACCESAQGRRLGSTHRSTMAVISDYVEFDSPEIDFDVVLHEQSLTHLTLTNVSEVPIAYKVKTTSPRRYCVRPNSDILPVGTAIDIELVLAAFESVPTDLDTCRDKFQLLIAPLDPSQEIPAIANLWKSIPSADTFQAKFRVKLSLVQEALTPMSLGRGDSSLDFERSATQVETMPLSDVADSKVDSADMRMGDVTVAAPGPSAPTVIGDRGEPDLERLVSAAEYDGPSTPPEKAPTMETDIFGRPKRLSVSPASLAALSAAPTVVERKIELGEAIERSMNLPGADAPDLSDQLPVDERKVELGTAIQRSNSLQKGSTPTLPNQRGVVDETAGNYNSMNSRAEAAVAEAAAVAAAEKKRARKESAGAGSASSPLMATAGGDLYVTAAPGGDEDELTEEDMAEIRARVLAGIAAPHVDVAELSEQAAQRAAVERAGQLMLVSKAKDEEIARLSSQLSEARHKLEDAKMAVLPAYDVKYEVDENARIPAAQIAVMALLSGVVLNLLV